MLFNEPLLRHLLDLSLTTSPATTASNHHFCSSTLHLRRLANQDMNQQARPFVDPEREQQLRTLHTTVQHAFQRPGTARCRHLRGPTKARVRYFQRPDDTTLCRDFSHSTPTRVRYYSAGTAINSSSTSYFQQPDDTALCHDFSGSTPTRVRCFSAGTTIPVSYTHLTLPTIYSV